MTSTQEVITKAARNASALLGLPPESLKQIMDGGKEILLVDIYKHLSQIHGGHDKNMRAWFCSENKILKGIPRDIIAEPGGIEKILNYLSYVVSK